MERHSVIAETRRLAENDTRTFRSSVRAECKGTTGALKAAMWAIALQYHLLIGIHAGLAKVVLGCGLGIDFAQSICAKHIGKLLPTNVNQRIALSFVSLRFQLVVFTLKCCHFFIHRAHVLYRLERILRRTQRGLIDLAHLDLKIGRPGFYFRLIAGSNSVLDEIERRISSVYSGTED